MTDFKKQKVLYIGSDDDFFNQIVSCLETESVSIEHFLMKKMSFSDVAKNEYAVIVIDGEYKNPLTIIETLRVLYNDFFKPYILLIGSIELVKTIKNQINIRNYPDDVCLKNLKPQCIVNQIVFGCSSCIHYENLKFNEKEIIKGDFNTFSYGKLLFKFYNEKFTGRLVVDSYSDRAVFSFLNGEPVDIKFNRIQFTLGRMLLRRGLIDEDTYLKSLDLMTKNNLRHGDALIELGVLTPSSVVDMIEKQYFEKLMYFFSKVAGSFIVIKGDVEFTIQPRRDIFKLIYSGVMQYISTKYVTDKFLGYKNFYIALLENFTLYKHKIPFSSDDTKILASLETSPSMLDVLNATDLDLVYVLKIFEILDICKMIQFVPTKEDAIDITKWTQPKMIELKEQIMSDYMSFKEKNYYNVLDLTTNCSFDEIKKRYIEKVKHYHPDKYIHMGLSKELMSKVNEIFQLIQVAYETLSNPESRKNYDAIISSTAVSDAMKKSSDILNAEIAFKKGEFLFKKRNYIEAEKYFRQAVALYDKEPEYIISLAVTLMFLKGDNSNGFNEESKSLLEKAVYMNPYFDKAYHYLGIWNKLNGNTKEAVLYFKKAIEINPANKEAILELKTLE